MVKYRSSDRLAAGVPLGGIGAGKAELDNRGKLVNITIANNWDRPIAEMMGFHVAVVPRDGEPFFVQSEVDIRGFSACTRSLEYEGVYPFARLYAKSGPIKATVEAFAAIAPGDLVASSLPAFGLSVKVEGSAEGLVVVSASNMAGSNPIGRINAEAESGVLFKNAKAVDCDPAKGEMALVAENPAWKAAQYNVAERAKFSSPGGREAEAPWRAVFSGSRPSSDVHEASALLDVPGAMVASEYDSGGEARFAISWYFTGRGATYPYGHYYHNQFGGALEVAEFFTSNFDKLRERTREWQREAAAGLSEWLQDAVLNSAYILSSSTWLDERERFGILESTVSCPCVNTLGTCYELGSLPIIIYFPELEKSVLTQFAENMREGYVPHDLGVYSLDAPTEGTTAPPRWKDLNPTFILLAYRYYKVTGDIATLKALYPKIVEAFEWELSADKDGDGLPELAGDMDNAFDATKIEGADSYTSSLWIAALMALAAMAEALGDGRTAERARGVLAKAREAFKSLFNGRYFNAWSGEPREYAGASFLAQIYGEWWTALLGLGHISEEDKIMSALKAMAEINGRASPYAVPNLVAPDGRIIDYSPQTYSSWPRLVFSMAALGYALGVVEWLDLAKKEWDNLVRRGLVWDQPSRINGHTGAPDPERGYLDHYIGSAALWSFVLFRGMGEI